MDDWSIDELLLGLLVELTEVPLQDAVDFSERGGDGTTDERRERLMSLLDSWAVR